MYTCSWAILDPMIELRNFMACLKLHQNIEKEDKDENEKEKKRNTAS